jgi:hypothetical protein
MTGVAKIRAESHPGHRLPVPRDEVLITSTAVFLVTSGYQAAFDDPWMQRIMFVCTNFARTNYLQVILGQFVANGTHHSRASLACTYYLNVTLEQFEKIFLHDN